MATIMATLDAPLLAELEELRSRDNARRDSARRYYNDNRAAVLARQRARYVRLLEERGQPTTRGRGRPRKQESAPALP